MAHKHLPAGHPLHAAWPVCKLRKVDCDRRWTEYLHFHPGQRCRKGQVARDNNRKMVTVCLILEEAKPAHLADLHERALRSCVGSVSLHNSHD